MLRVPYLIYIGIAIAASAGVFILYFYYAQAKIEALSTEVERVQNQLIMSETQVKILETGRAIQAERSRLLDKALSEAEKRSASLRKILAEHDLEFLALEKPKLIEKRINDATNKVFTSIEQSTSSQ